jgi:hypothetical protein
VIDREVVSQGTASFSLQSKRSETWLKVPAVETTPIKSTKPTSVG